MSEITHPNHIPAYLLRNYKVVFCPTRSVPIQCRLKISYCHNTVLHRPGCVYNTRCVYPEWSFIPVVITVTMVVDTGHLSPQQVLMESNTCAASWRYCPPSQDFTISWACAEGWDSCLMVSSGKSQRPNLCQLSLWNAMMQCKFSPTFFVFPYCSPLSMGFPDSSAGKQSSCNAEDPRSIPGLGRSWASLVAQLVKNPPAMCKTQIGKIT